MAVEIQNFLPPPLLQDIVVKKEAKYNFRYSNILLVPSIKNNNQWTKIIQVCCSSPVELTLKNSQTVHRF